MADPTIVQLVRTYFTSDFYKKAAEALDERKYETEKALSAIIPLILGAMLHKATADKESCESFFNDCRDAERVFSVNYDFDLLHRKTNNNEDRLFDKKHVEVEKEIARYSGIKNSSVSGLISLAVPSILGLLGKHIMRNKYSSSGLAGYLSSQEKFIAQAIPPTLESMESYFQLTPLPKSNKLPWDYSFQKFTTIKWKRWRRVIVIAVVLMVVAAVYFLMVR
ncbi:MAG: DUF937 domain-containing protein [Ginsengibacter sp.]|jgi:hypothetical protein